MAPVRLEDGDIVRTRDGYDGVIVQCIPTVFGFREFVVLLLDSGRTVKVNRLEVEKIDTLDADVDMGVAVEETVTFEAEPRTEKPATQASTQRSQRFATISNDAEIDELAASRVSIATKRQTNWAVRVFRGELILTPV